jgi:hypothetical protein
MPIHVDIYVADAKKHNSVINNEYRKNSSCFPNREERRGGQEKHIYDHYVYICSLFLDSRGRLLMMPSSSQVPDHQLISQIISGVGQFYQRPKRGEKTKTK